MSRAAWPLPLVLCAGLLAAPARAEDEKKIKLAAPSLSYSNLAKEAGDLALDGYARAMEPLGIRVVTANEVATLLGQERQKQILGCPDDQASACVLELAGALGVDGTVTGSLGKFGGSFQLNLVVLNAQDASIMASYAGRAETEKELPDLMEEAARATAGEVGKKLGKPAVAWRLNTLTLSPGGLITKRAGLAYERVLTRRFSLMVEPEFVYERAVDAPGRERVLGTALTLAAGIRWFWFAHAPEGFFTTLNLTFLTGYMSSKTTTVGQLGLGPRVELGYSFIFWSRLAVTLALGGQVVLIAATIQDERPIFMVDPSPVARLGVGLAF